MKIDLDLIDLDKEKNIEKINAFIEFLPKGLIYCFAYYSDTLKNEDDEKLGWESSYKYRQRFIARDSITGIDKTVCTNDKWLVVISAIGIADDAEFYFKMEKQATEFFDTLLNYINNE